MRQCIDCKHYKFEKGNRELVEAEAKYYYNWNFITDKHLCTLYPKWVEVTKDHYCGQYIYKYDGRRLP